MLEQKSDGILISLCGLSFHNFKKFINFFELATGSDKTIEEDDSIEEQCYPN
jgi:hypothetical protein